MPEKDLGFQLQTLVKHKILLTGDGLEPGCAALDPDQVREGEGGMGPRGPVGGGCPPTVGGRGPTPGFRHVADPDPAMGPRHKHPGLRICQGNQNTTVVAFTAPRTPPGFLVNPNLHLGNHQQHPPDLRRPPAAPVVPQTFALNQEFKSPHRKQDLPCLTAADPPPRARSRSPT